MIDEIEEQSVRAKVAERAYRNSDGHEFLGKALEPFSFLRRTAAIELGLRYWRLTPDDLYEIENPHQARLMELEAMAEAHAKAQRRKEEGGEAVSLAEDGEAFTEEARQELAMLQQEPRTVQMYSGLVYDTAIVLWLCSQTDATCQRARRKPRDYETAIDKFADANGLQPGGENFGEGVSVFMQMVGEVNESKAEPQLSGDGGSGAKN